MNKLNFTVPVWVIVTAAIFFVIWFCSVNQALNKKDQPFVLEIRLDEHLQARPVVVPNTFNKAD